MLKLPMVSTVTTVIVRVSMEAQVRPTEIVLTVMTIVMSVIWLNAGKTFVTLELLSDKFSYISSKII